MTKSKLLLEKVKKLSEIPLPDAWYLSSDKLSLSEKFQKIAEKEAAFGVDDQPLSDRINAIKTKYCNNDSPFKHTVYLNGLVSADFPVASYVLTIISCKKNAYTTLRAIEILKHEKLGTEFSTKKQEELLKILN